MVKRFKQTPYIFRTSTSIIINNYLIIYYYWIEKGKKGCV